MAWGHCLAYVWWVGHLVLGIYGMVSTSWKHSIDETWRRRRPDGACGQVHIHNHNHRHEHLTRDVLSMRVDSQHTTFPIIPAYRKIEHRKEGAHYRRQGEGD